MRLPLETVEQLISVMEQYHLNELDVEWDDIQVRLERAQASAAPSPDYLSSDYARAVVPTEPAGEPLESPMGGMFYRGPSPSEPPYVQEGDQIQEGQIIGLIEAMKVFNEIPSPLTGTIVKIVTQNGSLVQAGQVLMVVARETAS